ncbi:hypothetical protein [Priestia megaterium]|uniref:hypothetical protein n=1 Tax=Priestia megaterium TaxID=1404 RepID=UPI0031018F82
MKNKTILRKPSSEKAKLSSKTKKILVISMALSISFPFALTNEIVYAATKQINISFPESTSQKQTKTITLPSDFDSVSSATVNTGDISYEVDGSQMTVTVDNGTYTSRDSYTNPQAEQKHVDTMQYNSTNSFPSTYSFTDYDGFSGTLNASGAPYVTSGSYSAGSSKTVTETQTSTSTSNFPSTMTYDKDGYTGTLSKSGTPTKSITNGESFPAEDKSVTESLTSNTNSFPSTISYNKDGFSGTLTGGTPYVKSGSYTPKQTKVINDTKTGTDLSAIPDSIEYSDASGYVGTLTKNSDLVIKETKTENYTTTTTLSTDSYDRPTSSPTPLGYWTNIETQTGVDYIYVWNKISNQFSKGYYVKDSSDSQACNDWSVLSGFTPNWSCQYTWWDYYDNHGGKSNFDINNSTFYKSTAYAKKWVWTKIDRTYTQTYSGTVTKAASKKTASLNNQKFTNLSDIPDTIPYSDGSGYTATLGKNGSYRVVDVETPNYTSAIVTGRDPNEKPRTGNPTQFGYWVKGDSIGGLDRVYPNHRDSGTASSGWYISKTGNPCPSGSTNLWIRSGIGFECRYDWWDYYNNNGGDSAFDVRYGDFSTMPGYATEWFWTKIDRTYYQDYSGTAITPEPLDTRVWQNDYTGTVNKPASDTREYIYTQYYTGTVSGDNVDTRVWRQDYSGTAYKSATDYTNYKYAYNAAITYNVTNTSGGTTIGPCSYKGMSPASTTLSNYLPKCVTLDSGSNNLYLFKYDFIVTGISNSSSAN